MWNEPDFEVNDIARRLHKSPRTIEGHLRELYIALQPWRGTTARAMITVLAKAGWFDAQPVEDSDYVHLRNLP